MDKARSAGRSPLEYFGVSFLKEISIDVAANELVKELTGEYPVFSKNSSASNAQVPTSVSSTAMTALLSMYGVIQEDDADQKDVSKKIKDARARYLEQAGTVDKTSLAADFDDKVIDLLVPRLSVRTRLFYCEKLQKLSQAEKNGTSTKYQCRQEMAHFLCEIANPADSQLEIEVMNALNLIGDEKGNVLDGLFYLFGGALGKDSMKELELFDQITSEILASKQFDFPEDATKQNYRRKFIAKAREMLANRLPEQDRMDYFDFEQGQRKNWSEGRINYDNYRDRMMEWLEARPLQESLKMALDGDGAAKCDVIFVNLFNQNEMYNNRFHHTYVKLEAHAKAEGKVLNVFERFLWAAHTYVDSRPSVAKTDKEKYAEFVEEAKKQLLQALPERISKAHEEHVKVIEELLGKGYIEREDYNESKGAYLSGLIASIRSDESSIAFVASDTSEKLESKRFYLEENFARALLRVSRATNSTNAENPVTELWGQGHRSIEARTQLVRQLPEGIRKSYEMRENILLSHLERGHITQASYWSGMALFLHKKKWQY